MVVEETFIVNYDKGTGSAVFILRLSNGVFLIGSNVSFMGGGSETQYREISREDAEKRIVEFREKSKKIWK